MTPSYRKKPKLFKGTGIVTSGALQPCKKIVKKSLRCRIRLGFQVHGSLYFGYLPFPGAGVETGADCEFLPAAPTCLPSSRAPLRA
jgi:hypothetical protein